MFYKIINSSKLKSLRVFLNSFLIITYLTSFSSCATTESLTVSPDSLRTESSEQITKIVMKNGSSIDFENKIIEKINKTDTTIVLNIYSRVSRENTGTDRKEIIIPLNDILTVRLEKTDLDIPLTIIVLLGVLIVVGGLITLADYNFSFAK